MANYPQELAQDAVCLSHTGHMTGLWFLSARPLRPNTNEMNEFEVFAAFQKFYLFIPRLLAKRWLQGFKSLQINPKHFFRYSARTDISIHHRTHDDIRLFVVHLERP